MPKIVIIQSLDFYPDQIERLKKLGDITVYNDMAKSPEEWLSRCQEADIICSGSKFMKTEVYKLKDKFFVIPMVGYSWLEIEKLKENNIKLANCPGCNKFAVTEWILAMTINLLRSFPQAINTPEPCLPATKGIGLNNKKITILGKGNIGSLAGKIFEDFGANVKYFDKGDPLIDCSRNADIIINCLSTNQSTKNIINRELFMNLKKGAYFITITTSDVYDLDSMYEALENGILAGVAADCASISPNDTQDEQYQKMLNHPKVLVTPHIASYSDISRRDEKDIMIADIEAYLNGKPINLIT